MGGEAQGRYQTDIHWLSDRGRRRWFGSYGPESPLTGRVPPPQPVSTAGVDRGLFGREREGERAGGRCGFMLETGG